MRFVDLALGFLLVVVSVSAYSRGDFVQLLDNTDFCLSNCSTTYLVCNPTNVNYQVRGNADFNVSFLARKWLNENDSVLLPAGNLVKDYSLFVNYSLCWNESSYVADVNNNSVEVSSVKCGEFFRPLDVSNFVFSKNACYKVRVEGVKARDASVDNQLGYAGQTFSEYAWWNSSWVKCLNLSTGDALAENNTVSKVNVTCDDDSCQWGRLVGAGCGQDGAELGGVVENVSGNNITLVFVDSGLSVYSWYFGNASAVDYVQQPDGLLLHDEFNTTVFNSSGLWNSSLCLSVGVPDGFSVNISCAGTTTQKEALRTARTFPPPN